MVNDVLSDALEPSRLADFIRSMGVDISQLPGMMSQQPSFNPYQVLGLEKSASDEEVKHRCRELLYKLHPDTAGARGTEFLFTLVMKAYEQISKERRWSS